MALRLHELELAPAAPSTVRAAALALALVSSPALAGELFLTVSTYSLHFGPSEFSQGASSSSKIAPGAPVDPQAPARRREVNAATFGAGLGYRIAPRLELMAGAFENSLYRTSRYAVGAYWLNDHLGIAGGYLDGYDRTPIGVALVAAYGPARLVATPAGVLSLWFELPL